MAGSLWNYISSHQFQNVWDFFTEFKTDFSNPFFILVIYEIGGSLCWGSKKAWYSFRKNTWLWFCHWLYVLIICLAFRWDFIYVLPFRVSGVVWNMKGEKRNIQVINNYQKTFMIELKGKQDSCIGTKGKYAVELQTIFWEQNTYTRRIYLLEYLHRHCLVWRKWSKCVVLILFRNGLHIFERQAITADFH